DVPFRLAGVRGAGARAAGGSLLKVAANGAPPSVPAIDALAPGVTIALIALLPPFTHWTLPVSFLPPLEPVSLCSRSLAPSDCWLFVKLTNCPDCSTLKVGPGAGTCVGAVGGNGAPPTGL